MIFQILNYLIKCLCHEYNDNISYSKEDNYINIKNLKQGNYLLKIFDLFHKILKLLYQKVLILS